MHLMVRPVWPADPDLWLTPQIIDTTNVLYRLYERVTGTRAALQAQVAAVRSHPGELVRGRPAGPSQQNIGTFTGKVIDEIFKKEVHAARDRGELPSNLQITLVGQKGPDVWLDRVAWDITTAEAGKHHVNRDVIADSYRWDLYFVLGY